MKVYRCNKCKKMVVELQGSACPTMCCGEEMELLVANTTDAATEKHVPVCRKEDDKLVVTVGDVIHPMDEDHFIQFVVVDVGAERYAKCFKPGDVPEATFTIGADKIADGVVAEAFCNLHGLWSSE